MIINWNKVIGYGIIWLTLVGLMLASFLLDWGIPAKAFTTLFVVGWDILLGIEIANA